MGLDVTAAYDEIVITVPLPRSSIPGNAACVSTSGAVTLSRCTPSKSSGSILRTVRDQHIQPPELGLGPAHHLARGFGISDVGRDCQRLAARIPYHGRRFIQQPLPPPNQRHRRAFPGQRNRAGAPNPGPRAGNQCGLSIELFHCGACLSRLLDSRYWLTLRSSATSAG